MLRQDSSLASLCLPVEKQGIACVYIVTHKRWITWQRRLVRFPNRVGQPPEVVLCKIGRGESSFLEEPASTNCCMITTIRHWLRAQAEGGTSVVYGFADLWVAACDKSQYAQQFCVSPLGGDQPADRALFLEWSGTG